MAANLKALNGIKMLRLSTLVFSLLLFCSTARAWIYQRPGKNQKNYQVEENTRCISPCL